MSIDVDRIQSTDLFAVLFEENIQFDMDDPSDPMWDVEEDEFPVLRLIEVGQGRDGLARVMGKVIEGWHGHVLPERFSIQHTVAGQNEVVNQRRAQLEEQRSIPQEAHQIDAHQHKIQSWEFNLQDQERWLAVLRFIEDRIVGRWSELTWNEEVHNAPALSRIRHEDDEPLFTGGASTQMGHVLDALLYEITSREMSYEFSIRPVSITA